MLEGLQTVSPQAYRQSCKQVQKCDFHDISDIETKLLPSSLLVVATESKHIAMDGHQASVF